MKRVLFFVLLSSMMSAQTITFKGCLPLFDDQNFVFFKETLADATGRNVYVTTPVDGQDCSGLGSCEFKLQWNNTSEKWEFLADSGDGDFVNPNVIYSNSSASSPNPPDVSLGTWVENTSITNGRCGGNLTVANSTLIGAVQSSVLSTSDLETVDFKVYIPPVIQIIFLAVCKLQSSIF